VDSLLQLLRKPPRVKSPGRQLRLLRRLRAIQLELHGITRQLKRMRRDKRRRDIFTRRKRGKT
jgi:hypothetical protein